MAWPTVVAGCATEKDYSMTTKKPAPMPISDLTLRDFFAAHAMQGAMAADANGSSHSVVVRLAYQHADAMLLERAKP